MTTITIVEAAILAHLSKQPKLSIRRKLMKRLGPEALGIAKTLVAPKKKK